MLNLDTGIHLDEEPLVGISIEKKLNSTRTVVADRFSNFDGSFAEFETSLLWESDGRGDFHYLLVTALYRAVALVKMDDVPVPVSEYLHFDVLGPFDVAFKKYG